MIVTVEQGRLEGTFCKSELTFKEYCCFLGIPYARPPIGDLRFQPPQSPAKWDGVLEAKYEASACVQYDFFSNEMIGSEDCLYLNIYTPNPPSAIKNHIPVMVFIHGGAYCSGSATPEQFSADYLINYDIILVTIQYRLHALGFLDMGLDKCPGNCGLKDQQLAIKWIKENIESFGGDSNNITLFGVSAGAASVYLHLVSPTSGGLFHKAILHSGVYSNDWGLSERPEQNGFDLAQKLGYLGKDPQQLVEFLKKIPAKEICRVAHEMYDDFRKGNPGKRGLLKFLPTIESIKEGAFLPDYPSRLSKSSQPIPVIAGMTVKEGRLAFAFWGTKIKDILLEQFSDIMSHNCPEFTATGKREVWEKIEKFYFDHGMNEEEIIDGIVDLYTDLKFSANFYESLAYITKSNMPFYVYNFKFHGKFNTHSKLWMGDLPISYGAAHAEDMAYLFRQRIFLKNVEFDEPENIVIDNMCSLWTNFAKFGNPTYEKTDIEWKAHSNEAPFHLQIDDKLTPKLEKIFQNRNDFWETLRKVNDEQ